MIKHPSAMLYIFADEATFISKLDRRTAAIVRAKKANQYQLLAAEVGGYSNVNPSAMQIKQAFEDIYGMTPGEALVKLAMGEEVAGKNWAKGVYGVGAVRRNDFNQDSSITVDSKTGQILVNGTAVKCETIYGGVSGKKITSYVYRAEDGKTYTSQRVGTKYYAGTVTDADGVMQNANGQVTDESYTNTIWANCGSLIDMLLKWIMSLFGLDKNEDGTKKEMLTAENTMASQKDGFVEENDYTLPLVAAAAAGGYLLYSNRKKIFGK